MRAGEVVTGRLQTMSNSGYNTQSKLCAVNTENGGIEVLVVNLQPLQHGQLDAARTAVSE